MKTNRKSILTILTGTIAALSLVGCMSVGNKFDPSRVSHIKRGVTTDTELVSMFGQPNQRGVDTNGAPTMDWIYGQTQVKPLTFVPIVGAFAGGATSQNMSLHVTLGANGKVKEFHSNAGTF